MQSILHTCKYIQVQLERATCCCPTFTPANRTADRTSADMYQICIHMYIQAYIDINICVYNHVFVFSLSCCLLQTKLLFVYFLSKIKLID